jgi:hypothetical protein
LDELAGIGAEAEITEALKPRLAVANKTSSEEQSLCPGADLIGRLFLRICLWIEILGSRSRFRQRSNSDFLDISVEDQSEL